MFTAYVIVTALAAAGTAYAATLDFRRSSWVLGNMTKYGVSHSLLFPLGAAKALGAAGLVVGIGIPFIGIGAAVGLVLFFVGAIITVVRSHWYSHIQYPAAYLVMAAASLSLRVAA